MLVAGNSKKNYLFYFNVFFFLLKTSIYVKYSQEILFILYIISFRYMVHVVVYITVKNELVIK